MFCHACFLLFLKQKVKNNMMHASFSFLKLHHRFINIKERDAFNC